MGGEGVRGWAGAGERVLGGVGGAGERALGGSGRSWGGGKRMGREL